MNQLAAASAQQAVSNIILKANNLIINPIIVLMFALALIGFLWGVFQYIAHADDEEARAKGAQHILWGIVGMVIMISTFTIVRLIINTFGISDADTSKQVETVLGK